MKNTKLRGPLCLLICAFLWGTTFVAQSLGSDYIGPFTFNTFRFLTTGIILLVVVFVRKLIKKKKKINNEIIQAKEKSKKWIWIMAICVGLSLFMGASLQQAGIDITHSPAKAGFLTSTYIVFVPLIGICFKKKFPLYMLIFVITCLIGSFLISVNDEFRLEYGDILVLLCAVGYALQIRFIDEVNPYIDPIFLSAFQFLIAGILSFIVMLFKESFTIDLLIKAAPAILYSAILSGCIAFTLQIVGQKDTDPTVASLIMSLEAVFSLLSGLIILKEVVPLQSWIGSSLIFVSVILAQLDYKKIFKKKNI